MAGRSQGARRVTIADIAQHAGVSKGAVSYALNGQPGVSAGTRARILAIAERARLVPEPCRPLAVGCARRRLRARDRAAGPHARAGAVLHGARLRHRGRAVGTLDRAHDPARLGSARGDRGLPALVGGAPGRRGDDGRRPASTTRACRRSSSSDCRRSSSAGRSRAAELAGRLARRASPIEEAVRYLGGARPYADRPRGRSRRVRPHRPADAAPSRRSRASWASSARWSRPTTPRRAAPARPAACSRSVTGRPGSSSTATCSR